MLNVSAAIFLVSVDVMVIPELEELQEEALTTEVAAPPRCIIATIYYSLW